MLIQYYEVHPVQEDKGNTEFKSFIGNKDTVTTSLKGLNTIVLNYIRIL